MRALPHGAFRVGAVVVALLAVLAWAGGPASSDSVAPGVALPRVRTIGPLPEEDERILVAVDAAGRLYANGSRVDLEGLEETLRRFTHIAETRLSDVSSSWHVVLAIDEAVPWRAVQWILQRAAHRTTSAHRVSFVVLPEKGNVEGALATYLPKVEWGVARVEGTGPRLVVRFGERPRSNPAVVAGALVFPATGADARRVEVDAAGLVPTGYVLRVVDAVFQAGAAGVDFRTSDEPPSGDDPIGRLVQRAKTEAGVPKVEVEVDGRAPAGSAPPNESSAPRVRARPVGDRNERQVPPGRPGRIEIPAIDPDPPMLIGIGGGSGPAVRGADGAKDPAEAPAAPIQKPAEDAVEHALRWLAAHQSPDGAWECGGFGRWCDGKTVEESRRPEGGGQAIYDTGVTGLALCAFLGAGYTNRGDHPFAKVVSKGLRYLKSVQDPEGCFGPRTTQRYVFSHAIAALAMVEAYGMTQSPIFKEPAQKALDFVASARNRYCAWRYGVKPLDNDTTVSGWMAMVLQSARLINEDDRAHRRAPSFAYDEKAFDGLRAWLDAVTDPESGRVGYTTRGSEPFRPPERARRFPAELSESTTAVGCLVRILLREHPMKSEPIRRGAKLLLRRLPLWDADRGTIDMHYWHFGTLAMFQVGGPGWTAWGKAMQASLVPTQRADTDYCQYKGSWDPVDPWGPEGGRIYSTAMSAMCLEVYYRYDKVFETR